jgi:hypothetical protein
MSSQVVEPDDVMKSLVKALQSGDCVLFVGAGLSCLSGLPDWRALVDSMAKAMDVDELTEDYPTIAQAFQQKFGRTELERLLCEATDTAAVSPSPAHRLLTALGATLWVTTNFDDLLERTLDDASLPFHIVVHDRDVRTSSQKAMVVIKVHGDRSRPPLMVITKNDFLTCHRTREAVWRHLVDQFARRTFLFIGYSLRDQDFAQLQALLLMESHEPRSQQAYAVLFRPSPVVVLDLEARHVKVVDSSLESRGNRDLALYEFIYELALQVRRPVGIAPRWYWNEDAKTVVPVELVRALEESGYALQAAMEWHTYCSLVDSGQPDIQLDEFATYAQTNGRAGELIRRSYERWDKSRANRYTGVAHATLIESRTVPRGANGTPDVE